ncbi:MAG: endonuclease domain-containing protein [Candidatus Cyclobacteriaceae bacterium M2_1C_046]
MNIFYIKLARNYPPHGGGTKGGGMKADKENYYAYNKKLQPYANKLRKSMTKAEACLWKYALKARMRKGYGFRRQRPVLKYIADFMCKELKLIIEVDGITHTFPEVIQKDKIREQHLIEAGFHILRFDDGDVLNDINRVIQNIDRKIEEIEQRIN